MVNIGKQINILAGWNAEAEGKNNVFSQHVQAHFSNAKSSP